MTETRIKFFTKAAYDLLPTLDHARKWYFKDETHVTYARQIKSHSHLDSGVLQELFERIQEKPKAVKIVNIKSKPIANSQLNQ